MTTQDLTSTVVSRDGTAIAVDRYGSGPALVLVGGAFTGRPALAPFAQALAPSFTVLAYDRRGRGGSGDTPPYAIAREIEDLAAVIAAAGGPAGVYGHSSGAGLAVLAAAGGVAISRLALYEPPYMVTKGGHLPPADLAARITELSSSGRRGEAVEFWMKVTVGLPDEAIAQMRQGPAWPALEAVVHTAAYDATIMADQERGDPLPAAWASQVTVPTLIMDGENSPAWMHHAVDALAELLPDTRRHTFPGADHSVPPDALAPVLRDFMRPAA
jgi:pimeloyl-ACP methyl ester carboxylesterase